MVIDESFKKVPKNQLSCLPEWYRLQNNSGVAAIKHKSEHKHDFVGLEDPNHLPLSEETRELIEARLRKD